MKRSGINADVCLLGSAAAEAFIGNADVREALETNNFKVGALDLTVAPVTGAFYLGRINGIEFYEVTQQYVDDSGTTTDMLATDRAVLVASNAPFRVHLGPSYRIENQKAVAMMGEYFLEVDSESGSRFLQWNCEQKSLPTIHDPGAVISAKVV